MAKRMVDCNTWVRTFEVTEPTRHRKGFTVYKVTSVVFPRSFPESATKITVWKRYSDFRKLYKELELIFKQLYLKGEFPVFPKAKLFGRFEHEVVEERRRAALILMEFTANHTQLFTSKPFMQFFENGYSSQDFIGKILFSKGDLSQDPPTTVLQEKSEIPTPCLRPEILWSTNSENPSNGDDTVSLSPSSISSSISPTDGPETTLSARDEPKPCSSVSESIPSNLVIKENQETGNNNNSFVPTTATKSDISYVNLHNSSTNTKNYSGQSSHDHEAPESTTSKGNQSHRANGIVRSATVTDELSSYFNEEFEDAAFLFPTGSCSSLDTLPGFTPSSDVVDSAQKDIPSSSRGLFSLPRRKSSGFGFFDFLPLFPKRSSKKSAVKYKVEKQEAEAEIEQTEKVKKTSLSVGYICEAAGHFAVAQFHESNAEYENAFAGYKEGIRVLLAGAQDDADRDRKLLAKNKLEKYLARAESLKENFLAPGSSTCGNGTISPVFSSPNKKSLSTLTRFGKTVYHQNGKHLLCNLEELKPYKVIGVGPPNSKILIVMNPEETSPKCYATKVLWKSPCIIYPDKPTVIPCHIPFMVKLLKWFDTHEKIILLLEHAGGGRLEEFVKNYQSKRLSLSTPPDELSPVDEQKCVTADNGNNQESTVKDEVEITCNYIPESVVGAPSAKVTLYDDLILIERDESSRPITENIPIPENEASLENEIFSTPATSPPLHDDSNDNMDVLDVRRLLENSKALLQTVSRTLEEGSSPKKVPICRNLKLCDGTQEHNDRSAGQHANPENTDQPAPSKLQDDELPFVEQFTQEVLISESTLANKMSHKNSDIAEDFDDLIPKRMVPEGVIRVWTAEVVLALEALHDLGITYGDLQIKDILLGENGHILLRYKSLWTEIDDKVAWNAYTAPEVRDSIGTPLWKIHSSADWWSVGAILFFLLTGQSLYIAHPEGIYPEMIIKVPDTSVCDTPISKCAQTLMKELLQYSPEIRLGYYGAAEIKTHPFFEGFDWEKAIDECRNEEESVLQIT